METNIIYYNDCIDILPTFPDNSVNLILTDIPYNEVNRKDNGLRNLNKDLADVLTFDLKIFLNECVRVCSGSIYVFCGTEQVSEIRKHLVNLGLSTRHCIWEKNNPSPMNGQHTWLSAIENCIFGKKKGATFNEHCKSCVWKFPNGRGKQHPTEKPLKLFEYLIKVSSNEGDIVLDPCAGSGTTGVACKNLDRKYILVEKEEKYLQICKERLNG